MDFIRTDGADNIGSLVRLSFVECHLVTTPVLENPITKQVDITTLSASDVWKKLDFTSETGQLKIDTVDSDNGPLHKVSIECTVSKHTDEIIPVFEKYDGVPLLMIAETANGAMILIGGFDGEQCTGALIRSKYSSGAQAKSRDNYDLVISYESYSRPSSVSGFSEGIFA